MHELNDKDGMDEIDRAYRLAVAATEDNDAAQRRRAAVLQAVAALPGAAAQPPAEASVQASVRVAANEARWRPMASWTRGLVAACVLVASGLLVVRMSEEPGAVVVAERVAEPSAPAAAVPQQPAQRPMVDAAPAAPAREAATESVPRRALEAQRPVAAPSTGPTTGPTTGPSPAPSKAVSKAVAQAPSPTNANASADSAATAPAPSVMPSTAWPPAPASPAPASLPVTPRAAPPVLADAVPATGPAPAVAAERRAAVLSDNAEAARPVASPAESRSASAPRAARQNTWPAPAIVSGLAGAPPLPSPAKAAETERARRPAAAFPLAEPAGGDSLLAAVGRGDRESAQRLLLTTDPDAARDADGRTALALAVLRADLPLVKLLVAKGANRLAADRFGQTPLGYAEASGQAALVQALVQALDRP